MQKWPKSMIVFGSCYFLSTLLGPYITKGSADFFPFSLHTSGPVVL